MTHLYVADDTADATVLSWCMEDHTYETIDHQGYTRWHNGPCTCDLVPVAIVTSIRPPVIENLDDLPF